MAKPEDMPLYLLRCDKCKRIIKYYGEYPSSGKCGYVPCDGRLKLVAIFDPLKQRKVDEN
jgi:hypothetical protein